MPAKKPHERVEEALRGFMETDPKKVKEAEEREMNEESTGEERR